MTAHVHRSRRKPGALAHRCLHATGVSNGSPDDLTRPDRHPLSSKYDPTWILGLDMGPHPLWQLEDLLAQLNLRPGSRVLDLGCGKGATSVFLARECDVDVVAFDLWIDEAELRSTVEAQGVEDRVAVVNGDARNLPFQDDDFDAIVSIDAFEYFGTDVRFLPALLRVLKSGGRLGMTTPALRPDPYEQRPPESVTNVVGWEAASWHAPEWWATHWDLSGLVDDVAARMQPGGREDWLIWSAALGDEPDTPLCQMLAAANDDQLGFAIVTATKK